MRYVFSQSLLSFYAFLRIKHRIFQPIMEILTYLLWELDHMISFQPITMTFSYLSEYNSLWYVFQPITMTETYLSEEKTMRYVFSQSLWPLHTFLGTRPCDTISANHRDPYIPFEGRDHVICFPPITVTLTYLSEDETMGYDFNQSLWPLHTFLRTRPCDMFSSNNCDPYIPFWGRDHVICFQPT